MKIKLTQGSKLVERGDLSSIMSLKRWHEVFCYLQFIALQERGETLGNPLIKSTD